MKSLAMNLSTSSSSPSTVWNALRQAIAESSGFQEWLQSKSKTVANPAERDALVHDYLQETLSALAY
ncbi:MAG: hypothetical protein AAFX40_06515 [Cyanobacteria bacterium J06639_1]